MFQAETPAQFATALRWAYVPAFVFILSLVGFIRHYLRAGRPWLGWTICALWTSAVLLNFLTGQNLSYREILHLRHITFLGESFSIAVGISNPLMLFGQVGLLLFVIFIADATLAVWRRGDRRQALVTGGSILFCGMISTLQSVLVLWQLVDWPLMASPFTLGIVVAMGYELSRETLRAAQLAEDLRESHQQLDLAATAAKLGLWSWNIVRDEIWATDSGRQLFGFGQSERVNFDRFVNSLHPDDRETVRHAIADSVNHGGDYGSEHRVVIPGQPMRWIAARGSVEFNKAGKPVFMRGVSLDITSRKLTEAEILQQRAELAHVARISTMGELAASVAHELNQPLGAILANAEAADLFLNQDPPALDELRAILADIRKDDERASEVIRRMRDLLRKRELERRPVEINSVVEDVLQVVSGDIALRKMAISADLAPSLPEILGDRVHLQQVLLNLILNGMDAMADQPRERRRLTVRTRAGPEGLVELAVIDLGHGIEADNLPRLFEPFYTTKPKGMGMGLSISRTIIEAHRGRIWAENNASVGATFHVTLPVAAVATKP
jgi:signal transduction histidine kinase